MSKCRADDNVSAADMQCQGQKGVHYGNKISIGATKPPKRGQIKENGNSLQVFSGLSLFSPMLGGNHSLL